MLLKDGCLVTTSLYSESIFVVETQLAFQPEHAYPFFPKPQPLRGFDRPGKPGLKGCYLFDVSFFGCGVAR